MKISHHYHSWIVPAAVVGILCLFILTRTIKQDSQWWKFLASGEIYQALTHADNIIYVGDANGLFYAIDDKTGKELWHYTTDHAVSSQAVIFGDEIIFSTEDGTLFALETKTGTEKWRFSTPGLYRFITNPEIHSGTVLIGDANGSLYGLNPYTGIALWKFDSLPLQRISELPQDNRWKTSFIVLGFDIYFASTDGHLYAISLDSGKAKWSLDSGSAITTPITTSGSLLYIGNKNGDEFAISRNGGDVVWKSRHDSDVSCIQPLESAASFGGPLQYLTHVTPVIIAHKNGTIILSDSGRSVWTKQVDDQILQCPKQWSQTVLISGDSGTMRAIDAASGNIKWTQHMGEKLTAPLIVYKPVFVGSSLFNIHINTPIILVGDSRGSVNAINEKTGEFLWQNKCMSRVFDAPIMVKNDLLYSCSDGSIFRLNAYTGLPTIQRGAMTVSQGVNRVGSNNIVEFTIKHDDSQYPNPFEDVSVDTVFTRNGGPDITINGFYYDKDTWKVRFNPPDKGQWQWRLHFKTPAGTLTKAGTFISETDTTASFLRISKLNTLRLTQDNQTVFNGIGINDAILDKNNNGNPLDDWAIGDSTTPPATNSGFTTKDNSDSIVNVGTFAKTYGPGGGFNIYRWSINNASFGLSNSFTVQSKFLVTEGKYGDTLVQTLRDNGFHIWLTMFGFSIPFNPAQPNEMNALDTYVRYVVARYGAFVSIWEIANEAYASDEFVDRIAQTIKNLDFEHRPVSMSWEHPNVASVDIVAPHAYWAGSLQNADIDMTDRINQYVPYNKPILFGEIGNSDKNWSRDSALRMRIRSWVSFFKGAILVFWNQSSNKNYYNPVIKTANQYIGPEERSYIANLTRFTSNISATVHPETIGNTNPLVRSYGLASDKEILGYFYHWGNPEADTTTTTSVTIPGNATVEWYDPSSGRVLAKKQYTRGTYSLASPVFAADIALKISILNK